MRAVTKEGDKIQNVAKKENSKDEGTVYCCRYIKSLRNTTENLKCVTNVTNQNAIMKITERSLEKESNPINKKKNE